MSGPEWLEQRLGRVTDGLREDPGAWVRRETIEGLMEALRASAGQHQMTASYSGGSPNNASHCGQRWPCRTVQDVATGLEELL